MPGWLSPECLSGFSKGSQGAEDWECLGRPLPDTLRRRGDEPKGTYDHMLMLEEDMFEKEENGGRSARGRHFFFEEQ